MIIDRILKFFIVRHFIICCIIIIQHFYKKRNDFFYIIIYLYILYLFFYVYLLADIQIIQLLPLYIYKYFYKYIIHYFIISIFFIIKYFFLLFVNLVLLNIKIALIVTHDFIQQEFNLDYSNFVFKYHEKKNLTYSVRKIFFKPLPLYSGVEAPHMWKVCLYEIQNKTYIYDRSQIGRDYYKKSIFYDLYNLHDKTFTYNKFDEVVNYPATKMDLQYTSNGQFLQDFRHIPYFRTTVGRTQNYNGFTFGSKYYYYFNYMHSHRGPSHYYAISLKSTTRTNDYAMKSFFNFYSPEPFYKKILSTPSVSTYFEGVHDKFFYRNPRHNFIVGTVRNTRLAVEKKKYAVGFYERTLMHFKRQFKRLRFKHDQGVEMFMSNLFFRNEALPLLYKKTLKFILSDKYYIIIIYSAFTFTYMYITIFRYIALYMPSFRITRNFGIYNYIQRNFAILIFFSYYLQAYPVPFVELNCIHSYINDEWKYIIYFPWFMQFWKYDFFYRFWHSYKIIRQRKRYKRTISIPVKLYIFTELYQDSTNNSTMGHFIYIFVFLRTMFVMSHKWFFMLTGGFLYNIQLLFVFIFQTKFLVGCEEALIKYTYSSKDKKYLKEFEQRMPASYKDGRLFVNYIEYFKSDVYKKILKIFKNHYVYTRYFTILRNLYKFVFFIIFILFFLIFLKFIFLYFFIIIFWVYNLFEANALSLTFVNKFYNNFNYQFIINHSLYCNIKEIVSKMYLQSVDGIFLPHNKYNRFMYMLDTPNEVDVDYKDMRVYDTLGFLKSDDYQMKVTGRIYITTTRLRTYDYDRRMFICLFSNFLYNYSTIYERTYMQHLLTNLIHKTYAESSNVIIHKRLRASAYKVKFFEKHFTLKRRMFRWLRIDHRTFKTNYYKLKFTKSMILNYYLKSKSLNMNQLKHLALLDLSFYKRMNNVPVPYYRRKKYLKKKMLKIFFHNPFRHNSVYLINYGRFLKENAKKHCKLKEDLYLFGYRHLKLKYPTFILNSSDSFFVSPKPIYRKYTSHLSNDMLSVEGYVYHKLVSNSYKRIKKYPFKVQLILKEALIDRNDWGRATLVVNQKGRDILDNYILYKKLFFYGHFNEELTNLKDVKSHIIRFARKKRRSRLFLNNDICIMMKSYKRQFLNKSRTKELKLNVFNEMRGVYKMYDKVENPNSFYNFLFTEYEPLNEKELMENMASVIPHRTKSINMIKYDEKMTRYYEEPYNSIRHFINDRYQDQKDKFKERVYFHIKYEDDYTKTYKSKHNYKGDSNTSVYYPDATDFMLKNIPRFQIYYPTLKYFNRRFFSDESRLKSNCISFMGTHFYPRMYSRFYLYNRNNEHFFTYGEIFLTPKDNSNNYEARNKPFQFSLPGYERFYYNKYMMSIFMKTTYNKYANIDLEEYLKEALDVTTYRKFLYLNSSYQSSYYKYKLALLENTLSEDAHLYGDGYMSSTHQEFVKIGVLTQIKRVTQFRIFEIPEVSFKKKFKRVKLFL